jgi:hypothetical protein
MADSRLKKPEKKESKEKKQTTEKTYPAAKGSFIETEITAFADYLKEMKKKVKDQKAKDLLTNVKKIVRAIPEFLKYFDEGEMISMASIAATGLK